MKVVRCILLVVSCSLFLVSFSKSDILEERLFVAVDNADLAALKSLVADGVDLDMRDTFGDTLLLRAVTKGDIDVVGHLLGNGASVSKKGIGGDTPLIRAAAEGHLPIVRLLLGKGAKVNEQNVAGATPVAAAALGGHKDVVQFLFSQDADGNVFLIGGSPLIAHVAVNDPEMLRLLVQSGVDTDVVDGAGYSSLMHAGSHGQLDAVVLLVEAGAKLDTASSKRLETVLFLAAEHGHEDVVARLIEAGADLNARNRWGWTARSRAKAKSFESVVSRLEDAGASTNWVLDEVSLDTAELVRLELETVDGAIAMWRMAHSKKAGDVPKWSELEEYFEDGSPLKERRGLDVLGNPIILRSRQEGPRIAEATRKRFEAAISKETEEHAFWGKYGK